MSVDPVDALASLVVPPPRRDSWGDLDLADALSGEPPPPPSIGRRDDGAALFYPGKVNSVAGEPEVGKGWVVIVSAAQEMAAGRHVIYIDFEDSATSVVGRLLAVGVDPAVIGEQFHYKRPDTAFDDAAADELLAQIDEYDVALVIIDGVTEALSVHGLEPNSNADVARFWALLPRLLADAGPAVVLVDHVVKNKEGRGRWAIGASHKLAMIDGAAYVVEVVRPFARGRDGMSKVVVAKDRSGFHQRGAVAAELQVTSWPDGGLDVTLAVPTSVDADGNFRPTVLMGRVSSWLAERPGEAVSTRAVVAAVKGNAEALTTALRCLEREGNVTLKAEPNGNYWTHVEPFTADD